MTRDSLPVIFKIVDSRQSGPKQQHGLSYSKILSIFKKMSSLNKGIFYDRYLIPI